MSKKTVLEKVREAGLHSLIYGLGSLAQSAAQFIQIPILTAVLSPAEFGVYSLIQMASAIASAVFYLGMTSAMPRSYFDYEDEENRKRVFTTAFLILLVGAIVQTLVGWIAGRAISNVLVRSKDYSKEVFFALLGGALGLVNQYFFAYLRFLRKSVTSVLLGLVTFCGSTGLTVVLIRLHPKDLSGPFVAVATVQAIIAALLLVQYGRRAFSPHISKREIILLLKFGIPIVLTNLAVMIIDWSDRILIERLLSISDVGTYSVGYKIGSLINVLIIAPFAQIWSIMMIEYRSHDNNREFFKRILSYYFMIGCSVVLTTAMFVRELIPFVIRSGQHASAIPVIVLVMVGALLYGSTNIVAAGLVYERKVMTFAAIYYVFAILKIGLNILMIPLLGISGAALTTLVIWGLIPFSVYWFAKRYFALSFDIGRLMRLTAICSLPVVFVLFIEPVFQIGTIVKVAIYLSIIAAIVVLCTEARERELIVSLAKRLRTRR